MQFELTEGKQIQTASDGAHSENHSKTKVRRTGTTHIEEIILDRP
jgi:hypothetical protein